MTPKQQVEDSAWRRAVLDAEHEVFRRTAGHSDYGGRDNEYHRGGYKNVEQYALEKRTKSFMCIELLKAAIVERDNIPTEYCNIFKEIDARNKIWKSEVENRERDLIASIAGVDGGRHRNETVIGYAERSLMLQEQALEKLAFARKGLEQITDDTLRQTLNKKTGQDWSPCG